MRLIVDDPHNVHFGGTHAGTRDLEGRQQDRARHDGVDRGPQEVEGCASIDEGSEQHVTGYSSGRVYPGMSAVVGCSHGTTVCAASHLPVNSFQDQPVPPTTW